MILLEVIQNDYWINKLNDEIVRKLNGREEWKSTV